MQQVSLEKLREVDTEARKIVLPRHFDPGLGALGLILDTKLDDSRYPNCTPINCKTFAHTGGNGVHFSLLQKNGSVGSDSPVVVTNPAGDGLNFIVGKNLYDFLCLGYYRGYFAMEQLAYKKNMTLEVYTTSAWKPSEPWHSSVGFVLSDEKRQVLDLLISRCALRPWPDASRFHRLQEEYLSQLRMPTE